MGVLFACASTSVPKRKQLIDVVSSGCKPPFSYGPNIRSRTFMLYKSDVAFLQLEENYDNFFSRKYGQVGSYFVHPPAHSCFEKADALLHAMDLTAPSRDKNGTDIFRPYSKQNLFRGVEICPYPSPDIQHPIPVFISEYSH